MELTLYHLFPERLNLYGDRGNVIVLRKRCEWRSIELNVVEIRSTAGISLAAADLLLIGGGSDREQGLVTQELMGVRAELKDAIEDGLGVLAICGGYQFLGDYYETADGVKYGGMEILPFYTVGKRQRLVGNVAVQSADNPGQWIVGFENHSGRTYHSFPTLGKVVRGHGNNGEDGGEGLVYRNVIGTYLHGPILPKNPLIADRMISAALERKYGQSTLQPLDDSIELAANRKAAGTVHAAAK